MKKTLFSVVCMLVFAVVANAQLFVGGNIGFSSYGGTNKVGTITTDINKVSSFSFEPKVGYIVSENLYVGVDLILSTSKTKFPNGDFDKTSEFGLAPFARYYAVRFNKFSIFAQGRLRLSFESEKNKVGADTNDGPKTTNFGFSIFPGIAYEASDKIELEAYVGGFGFGFNSSTEKGGTDPNNYINKRSSFGFGVDADNILTTGNVTIGLIFKL